MNDIVMSGVLYSLVIVYKIILERNNFYVFCNNVLIINRKKRNVEVWIV